MADGRRLPVRKRNPRIEALRKRYEDAQANPEVSTAAKRLAARERHEPDLLTILAEKERQWATGESPPPEDRAPITEQGWRKLTPQQIAEDWEWFRKRQS